MARPCAITTDPFAADLLATRHDYHLRAVVEKVTTKLGLLRERRNARQRDSVRDAIGIVLAVDTGDDDALPVCSTGTRHLPLRSP